MPPALPMMAGRGFFGVWKMQRFWRAILRKSGVCRFSTVTAKEFPIHVFIHAGNALRGGISNLLVPAGGYLRYFERACVWEGGSAGSAMFRAAVGLYGVYCCRVRPVGHCSLCGAADHGGKLQGVNSDSGISRRQSTISEWQGHRISPAGAG